MPTNLAVRLRGGETVFMTWHTSANMDAVDAAARGGIGCVTLDIQHGGFGFDAVVRALPVATLAGASVAVRLAVHDYATAGRVVDAGAEAVIAPLIETADDAKQLVDAVKYLPVGMRSWGPLAAMQYAGFAKPEEQLQKANNRVLAFAMIETKAAVDNLDDILAVDGLDGVFVGPSDLSIALSDGAVYDPFGPASLPVIERVGKSSVEAGKLAAIFTTNAENAKKSMTFGYSLISLSTDKAVFSEGIRQVVAAIS